MILPYSQVDQSTLRKKTEAIKPLMEPVGNTELSSAKLSTSLSPSLENTAKPAIENDTSGLDKVGGLTGSVIAPISSGALSVYNRVNTVAENGKEADAAGIKTTMDLASTGGKIGSLFGPVGGLVGTGVGAVGGAIFSAMRSNHDKKMMQRREQKKYTAGLVKASTERDRDNRMEEAQSAIATEKQLISTQLGLIG